MSSDQPLRWGVLGTGRIAHDFSAAITQAPGNKVVLVAGRSPEAAAKMAKLYGARGTTASGTAAYAELMAAEDVDVIYVATFHGYRGDQVIQCLRAGKHVLCEKPLAMNAPEARHIVAEARKANRFLAEGHWTQHFPAVAEARRVIREGTIGEVVSVIGDFSFPSSAPADAPELDARGGGGVTMLLGVYPLLAVLRFLGGRPEAVLADGRVVRLPTGTIDVVSAAMMRFPGGRVGIATAGFDGEGAQETLVVGTKGRLVLGNPAHAPSKLTVYVQAGERNRYHVKESDFPLPEHPKSLPPLNFPNGQGMVYEVGAVSRAIRDGRTEAADMPLDASVALAEVVDEVRAQLGVFYPADGFWYRLRRKAASAVGPRLTVSVALAAVVVGLAIGRRRGL